MRGNKFRNFKRFLWSYLALLLIMLCGSISMSSCDKLKSVNPIGETPDSVYVAKYVEAIVNPTFNSVQELKMLQSRLIEEYSIDETFRLMPGEVLTNVATVCLKKDPLATKKDIVSEYLSNRAVYDNLPEKAESSLHNNPNEATESPTAMEEQQKPVGQVSYRHVIDTINGKPVKVCIKEERTYDDQ